MDLRGEQLGQGAAGRLLPAGATGEIKIGIHREAHAGQHVTLAEQIVAAQTDRFPQPQPGFNPAVLAVAAVVVEDPLHPFAPGLRNRAVGHNCRVFQRNSGLVIKPVRHPTLNLLAGRVAVMHGDVVRVVNMVEGAFSPQSLFKGLRRQRVSDQHAVS